jgi:RHS repeat-associated protein
MELACSAVATPNNNPRLPFGSYQTTPTTNPGPTNHSSKTTFTGHKHNDYIKMIYMGARWYLPNTNRFLTPDSIVPEPTNPQSYNRYSYALNNPMTQT